MLSKRLSYLVNEVPFNSIVADIGCDHGYLVIELAQKGQIKKGFACDVNEGPLQSAKINIEKYHYQSMIETRLGSGVSALTETDKAEVDTLVVAGMGGALIRDIIEPSLQMPQLQTLILQPNIGADIIREYLMKTDFELVKEMIVNDNGIMYPILVYKKNALHTQKWEKFEMTIGPFILRDKSLIHVQYVAELKQHWQRVINQLNKSTTNQTEKKAEYEYLIKKAEEWENGND